MVVARFQEAGFKSRFQELGGSRLSVRDFPEFFSRQRAIMSSGSAVPAENASAPAAGAVAGSTYASDMATPEHIAQLTQQLSTLLNDTVEHIAGLNREARILALNAEIESARAGDAGVAFGVVAKAMSHLSEKS